jgi:hypothetical protein
MTADSADLLRRARGGDAATLGRLLEQYRRYLAVLARAVQEYLEELEAGLRPDRHAWAVRFPDLDEALRNSAHAAATIGARRSLQGTTGGLGEKRS